MNPSSGIVACNSEAVRILTYAEGSGGAKGQNRLRTEEIRSRLLVRQPSGQVSFVREVRSGKRSYRCRMFHLDQRQGHGESFIAVLIERNSPMFLLSEVIEHFRLTPRERQAAEYLLQGLASKEIAERMKISPNTVKAFLRLIMIKMGASSRTGIIAKIISTGKGPSDATYLPSG